MEIECKIPPPPSAQVVHSGQLSRFSRASGRFIGFSATLCHELTTSASDETRRCTLYLVDRLDKPFSCIILGPSDTVKNSSKSSRAFSIIGKAGGKTVLQASSRDVKEEWMRILKLMFQGSDADVAEAVAEAASVPSPVVPTTSCAASSTGVGPVDKTTAPVVKGLLFKKGTHSGQYVRRWFELVRGDGLLYAAYGDSPRESFRQVPLKGLSVVFAEDKRKILIPPSAGRPQGLTLKLCSVAEFALWREAIHAECLDLPLARNEDCTATAALQSSQNFSESRGWASLPCADEGGGDNVLLSSTSARDTSFVSADGLLHRAASVGVADNVTTLTEEELAELDDLQGDAPCGQPFVMEEFLRSIGEKYRPLRCTVGIEDELQRYCAECLPYGLEETLLRLRKRLAMPIKGPYETLNEHMVLLELDVERVRDFLRNVLGRYGEEFAARNVVREVDYILRIYTHVRERLLIRLEIAAFREEPNHSGLPLGVNGTMKALDTLLLTQTPTEMTYGGALDMWRSLFQALQTFRLDFDVFDESEETIVAMESALNKLYARLQQRSPESSEDLRSLRQDEARQAYGNTERSRETHDSRMEKFNVDIRENSAMRNRSVVLAALSGLVSAAGVLGALSGSLQLRRSCVFRGAHSERLLIFRAVVDGVAIAYTTWHALVFERVVYDIELKRELWEIENHLTGEIREMVEIYKAQGLSEEDALIVTRIFAKQRTAFANLMMVEELGYSRLEPPGWREAVVDAAVPVAIGYTFGWVLPLLPLTVRGLNAAQSEMLGFCMLIAGGTVVSVAQSEVFYGGYASIGKTLKVALWNMLAVGTVFGASRMVSSLFRGGE